MIKLKKILTILGLFILIIMPAPYSMAAPVSKEQREEPRLVLESYKVTDGISAPGKEISLELTLRNTSSELDINNALVTYSSASNALYPINGKSNQLYIDNIPAGKKVTADIRLVILKNYTEDTIPMDFKFEYQDSYGSDYINNSQILYPVENSCKLDIYGLSVADSSSVGSKTLISLSYGNSSEENFYNIIMKIEGDINDQQKEIFLGDLAGGSKNNLDYYVNFNSSGEKLLKISFSYKDGDGNTLNLEPSEYKVNVSKEASSNIYSEPEITVNNNSNSNNIITAIAVCILILIIAAVTITHFKKKQNHK